MLAVSSFVNMMSGLNAQHRHAMYAEILLDQYHNQFAAMHDYLRIPSHLCIDTRANKVQMIRLETFGRLVRNLSSMTRKFGHSVGPFSGDKRLPSHTTDWNGAIPCSTKKRWAMASTEYRGNGDIHPWPQFVEPSVLFCGYR